MSKASAEKPQDVMDTDMVMDWWKKLGVLDQLSIWSKSATARPEIMDMALEPQVRSMFQLHFKLVLGDPEKPRQDPMEVQKELEDFSDMYAIANWWEDLKKDERDKMLKLWLPKRYTEVTLGGELRFGDILDIHKKINKK